MRTLGIGRAGWGHEELSNGVVDEEKIVGRCKAALPEECPPLGLLRDVSGQSASRALMPSGCSSVLRRSNVALS